MAYYRRHMTYNEIAPYVQRLRVWLRTNCAVCREYEEYGDEAFFFDEKQLHTMGQDYRHWLYVLESANMAQYIPYIADRSIGCIVINERADGEKPTVSKTHIRLPSIRHLATLTPEDFFNFLKIIAGAQMTQTASLTINPTAVGIDSIDESSLFPFFQKVRTNYRINVDFADKRWTSFEDVKFLAALEPTRDNQFSAIQYLLVRREKDVLYFPAETVVQLELDWQQVTDEYCIPQP